MPILFTAKRSNKRRQGHRQRVNLCFVVTLFITLWFLIPYRQTKVCIRPTFPAKEVTEEGVILTSLFTGQLDPQRKSQVSPDIHYMENFVSSVVHLGLRAVIFHDQVDDNLVDSLQRKRISFVKRTLPSFMTINDYRFVAMIQWLKANVVKFIVVADISDVVFLKDPFDYLSFRHKEGKGLFLSDDFGTFSSNRYHQGITRQCYPYLHVSKADKIYSAGLWAGEYEVILQVLECIVKQLEVIAIGRGNCNMPVFNLCVQHILHADLRLMDECANDNNFFNQFTLEDDCTSDHFVVHDKCNEWARYTNKELPKTRNCVTVKGAEVALQPCDPAQK